MSVYYLVTVNAQYIIDHGTQSNPGKYHFNARWYDAETARFVSRCYDQLFELNLQLYQRDR
jgi:hypothetical protein